MNNDPFVTVSDDAVLTVLKCLGLPFYQYEKCRIAYRDLRWCGMSWSMYQYYGMLDEIVIPYFKDKFNE